MKRKIIKATILILMSISITGCNSNKKSNENSLYETDIIGEWVCTMQNDSLYLKFDESVCTHEVYSGYYEYKNYTINELNDDIDLVEINSWQLYKFYNILGNYYEINEEIPDVETFKLDVENDGSIEYTFTINGELSIKYDDYIPVKTYNYYKKENIIYDKDTEKILFYIVKNGIFSPQYYKVK